MVLARLLVPEDFGIIAFAVLLSSALTLLATLGIGPSLVVAKDLSRVQLGSALSLLVGLNAACAVVLLGVSPLAGELVGGAGSTAVIAAMGIPLLFRGVSGFNSSLLQRHLLFRRRAGIQLAEVFVSAVVAVGLAAAGAGVWSLVVGQSAGAFAAALISVPLAPFRVRPSFDVDAVWDLWRAGRGFMLQAGASFTEQNADYLVIGSMLGAIPLGYYSMAYRLSELPYNSVVDPVAQVTFPGFARLRAQEQEVVGRFLTLLRTVAFCAFPLGLVMSGTARPLTEALFGPQWTEMIALLVILGLWGSLRTIQATIAWFVNSTGFAYHLGRAYAVMLVISLPLVVIAATISVEAVALVMVLNLIVMTVVAVRSAHAQLGVAIGEQWAAVRPSVIAGLLAWVGATAVSAATGGVPP